MDVKGRFRKSIAHNTVRFNSKKGFYFLLGKGVFYAQYQELEEKDIPTA